MLRLHDYGNSGNGYKVRLLPALGLPFTRVEYDIDRGERRTPELLRKNPNGRIPVLELEDGRCLAESNAILVYLAEGTRFLREERLERALVLQWLFFEQYAASPTSPRCATGSRTGCSTTSAAPKSKAAAAAMPCSTSWSAISKAPLFPLASATPSPTSRSMPTPMSPARAASISPSMPRSGAGSAGSQASPANVPITRL